LPTAFRQSRLIAWSGIGGCLALLALLLGGAWGIFLGTLAGVGALMLALNWFQGPSCECRLQTAVQTETLPSLSRLRTALQVVKRLRARIEGAQGRLTPEFFHPQNDPQTQPDLVATSPAGSLPVSGSQTTEQPTTLLRHTSVTAHACLFTLLLFDAVLTAVDINVNHVGLTLAGVLVNLGVTASTVWALIQQNRTDIGRFVRWQVLASLGYVCVLFLLSGAYSLALGFDGRKRMETQWDMIVAISQTSARDSTWLMTMSIFSLVCTLAIAIPGWIGLVRFWAQSSPRLSRGKHRSMLQL
jgi:hypothetical protein